MTVDCLDAHLLHQRGDVQPPDLGPFTPQKPLQHPTSGERIVEVQFVDPPHQVQIAVGHLTWRIVDTATAEAEARPDVRPTVCVFGRSFLSAQQSRFAERSG